MSSHCLKVSSEVTNSNLDFARKDISMARVFWKPNLREKLRDHNEEFENVIQVRQQAIKRTTALRCGL